MRRFIKVLVGAVLTTWVVAGPAEACGLTPPIGPTGLPAVCHGDGAALGIRAGIAAGGTSTRINFSSETAALLQGATSATLDLFPLPRLGISAALGASLGGRLDYGGSRYDLLPGPLGGLGVSYRLFGGAAPFIHTSFTYSLASTTTRAGDGSEATFTSRDWRVGVAVGKTLGRVAAPFAMARYFGAGTNWSPGGGKGADAYRYHVGVGSAFALSEHIDALAELAFLGERRGTIGVGYAF